MVDSLLQQLDQFGRRHPHLMLAVTLIVAILTTLVLVYNTKDTAIVYRAF